MSPAKECEPPREQGPHEPLPRISCPDPMKRARLLRRYKRFLVDLERPDGSVITAYCPATGRLSSCYRPGSPVSYSPAGSPDRKLDYDWWSIRMEESWVVIDPRPAEDLARRAGVQGLLPGDFAPHTWQAQASPEGSGRLDFLEPGKTEPDRRIEVKAVTWREDGAGWFPDAPSQRAARQVESLTDYVRSGGRAAVLFVAMREDLPCVRPAVGRDSEFTERLTEAYHAGVQLLGVDCSVGSETIRPRGRLPVQVPDGGSHRGGWNWKTVEPVGEAPA